ncbi:hypothetical protein [Mesorhizobium sp. M1E.F.Ca.ET.063.01.1.1]|uniref:hypothetical protein n=1 Tax=Mesorhizobium sp. M1E.F.Ca.ET.063.01.1.1 TaxID=2496750 RepID=UPI00167AEFF9|nr:hypothetical protein [Mesorhizobium sp. M1E.F.Ca.ET.063.01.1.1]
MPHKSDARVFEVALEVPLSWSRSDLTHVKAHLDRAGDPAECDEPGSRAVLGRSCQIWQRDDRTASGTFGAIMLAFGLALFLLLTPSAQAHEFSASQGVSLAKVVPSIGDCKADQATSMATVLFASAPDDSGCHDGAAHANCGLCVSGHCFACSAAVLAAASDIGLVPVRCAPVFIDQSGAALTKPDETFRPPRSVL